MKPTPEEFKNQMANVAVKYADDPEKCHYIMDSIMCTFMRELGYGDGVNIFIETDRWYS